MSEQKGGVLDEGSESKEEIHVDADDVGPQSQDLVEDTHVGRGFQQHGTKGWMKEEGHNS